MKEVQSHSRGGYRNLAEVPRETDNRSKPRYALVVCILLTLIAIVAIISLEPWGEQQPVSFGSITERLLTEKAILHADDETSYSVLLKAGQHLHVSVNARGPVDIVIMTEADWWEHRRTHSPVTRYGVWAIGTSHFDDTRQLPAGAFRLVFHYPGRFSFFASSIVVVMQITIS